ncbi:MAG: hypothetical protein IRZ03_12075 [Acidobacterium ailaaui]|nr:hypothetical protein [Pseudacidobacterium ailaaui]
MTKIWPQFLPKSASGRRKFALFLLPLLLSCQSVENTRKVAVHMSQTAQELRDFYMALTVTVAQQAELERLQSAFFAVPLSQQDLTQLESIQEELKKRSEMAESLSEFSQTLAEFAGPKTKETVAQSATNLGSALAGIQQLPGTGFAPEALQHSGNLLVQWIQQRNTRKMAQAMDSTLAALAEMFSREKPAYDSINRTYMELAQSLALELLRRKQIRFDSLALPALKPFGLVPAVPAEASSSSLQEYARKQITERTDEEMAAYVKASEGLQEMLDFMAQRTHALASGGPLPVREPQPKSTEIERWVHLVAGESKTCENSP